MKKSEIFFGALLLPTDFLALLLAAAAAYYLRISPYIQDIRAAVFEVDLTFREYMQLSVTISLVIIGIFAIQGLYSMEATRRILDEVTRIFAGISIGVMLVIVAIFLSAELFQSRFILLAAYIFAVLFVTVARYGIRLLQKMFLRKGYGVHRVVLAGSSNFNKELTMLFERNPSLGYRVVGVETVVRWDLLEEIYHAYGIDEVIQTDPTLPEEDNLVLLDFCEKYKIDYKYIPNIFETYATKMRFRQIGSVPLMELLRTPLDGWGRVVKRIFDIIASILGLIVLAPLLFITALLIKLDSKGTVFYRQTRVGRNMKYFDIMKFRSMKSEFCLGEEYGGKKAEEYYSQLKKKSNERTGPLFKMKKDPRITRVGRSIRRWRIDELPQLFNVLKGDMSLIGPRPHLQEEVAEYEKYHQRLFTIKPGMSGMAQVNGNAGLPFDEEAKLDIAYIENWSMWLDIILIIKTFRILLFDKNAV